jgi:predicted metal-dependent peptidase
MDEVKLALERSIYQLLYKVGGYYACVVTAMQTKFTNEVPLAGVRFTKEEKTLEMAINPDAFLKLTEQERVGLLLHEVMHVLNLHILNRDKDFPNHKLGNIAQDIAINDILADIDSGKLTLPEGGCLSKGFGFPNKKSADYYYGELVKREEENKQQQGGQQEQGGQDDGQSQDGQPQQGKGKKNKTPSQIKDDGTSMDSHDWECDGKPQQEKVEAIKNTLERAKERAEQLGSAGKIPSEVQETLSALEKMKVRQWHRELMRFTARHTDGADRVRTWSRPNKRYGLWEAGNKSGPNKKLIIGIDTSGSMCQTEIEQALAECKAMLRCSVEAEVWFFDTKVNTKAKLKKDGKYNVGGRGGTDFNDFFTQAKKAKPDAVVVFTDGDDQGNLEDPRMPILWVLTAGDRDTYQFGRKVVLDK